MDEIFQQRFEMVQDLGGRIYRNIRLIDCVFDNCRLSSLVDTPASRSVVQSVELRRCRNFNSGIGPARFEDVLVDGFRSNNLLILWAPIFRHVKLQGVIRSFKVNRIYSVVNHHPLRQHQFDQDADTFYQSVDWALDITEAKLSTCEIEGVPVSLIRYDRRYALAVSRESATRSGWQSSISPSNPWRSHLELFQTSSEKEVLLVAPYGNRLEREGLQELADSGLGS